jgi:hypothetical protein
MNERNLLDVADADVPIYRIFSKQRFLDLLASGQNGLVNPSKWEDPFENFFLRSLVVGPGGERISIRDLAADWYGQCWTYNNDTDAMWRIYSHTKDGVKVGTTVRKLFARFYDPGDRFADLKFFCGKVGYYTENEIATFMGRITFEDVAFGGQATKFAELLCVKREAFAHEREIRLLFQDTDPKRGAGGVVQFDFDMNATCDEVVLDPRLSDTDAAAMEGEIRAAGCTLPLSRSSLYRVPNFQIRLS